MKRGIIMFSILWEEKIITIFIAVFFLTSLLLQFLLCRIYENMIHETENMAATDNKLLKQCKLKFSNCYRLNNGVPNIPVFVDKFLSRLAIGPISFQTIYHLSGQALLLSMVGSGAGICKSIAGGRMFIEILPFYIISLAELYIYFSLTTIMDVNGRKKTLKINLVDYLENHLSARMDTTEKDMDMLYGSKIKFMPIINRTPERTPERIPEKQTAVPDENISIFSEAQEQELEGLLMELLGGSATSN
jgi:hypothetical protein